MLRTANLHLFHIGIHRFSTIGHPKALDACYGAHRRLLRPDFHWQAVDNLQNTRLSPIRNVRRKAHQKRALRLFPKRSLRICGFTLILLDFEMKIALWRIMMYQHKKFCWTFVGLLVFLLYPKSASHSTILLRILKF